MFKAHSEFKLTSLGTVAADKNDGSKFISVYLREHLPFTEGDVTDQHIMVERNVTDADGNQSNVKLFRGMAIKAEWYGEGNRIDSPPVRKGETVEVYELGETGQYFWKATGRSTHLRRGDRATYGFNASDTNQETDEAPTAKNQYTVSVDGKSGHMTARTTMANGEIAAYTFQLHGKNGAATLADNAGNTIQIDSANNQITMTQSTGETIALKDGRLFGNVKSFNITASESVNIKAPNITLDGIVNTTSDLTIAGKVTADGGKFNSIDEGGTA